jgi:hypothetical protein
MQYSVPVSDIRLIRVAPLSFGKLGVPQIDCRAGGRESNACLRSVEGVDVSLWPLGDISTKYLYALIGVLYVHGEEIIYIPR